MYTITFSKAGQDDIVLTENDLFDFQYEASCFSGETFELGGVNARKLYLLIDNNAQRFSRGTFANTRIKLEINGSFFGYYNAELPKRRNGVIEVTAYDDMTKLDVEFPTDYTFPQTFWSVYAQCVFEAGLASEVSFDNVVLNGVWNNGVISADYTDYIYANSCRKLVSGMAEWNGGYAHINADGKLQVDKFSTDVTRQYSSGDLMELDYSDETITFTKIKTSQKNKTYEMGTDDGYTLVINNQYISYGLDDSAFELYFNNLYDYYKGFTLTPMTFTLAEPDLELNIGDRIQVYDEEEQVTVTGNVSKIEISGNCSMTVTCGGFENVSSASNYTPTSFSQVQQANKQALYAKKLISPDGNSWASVQNAGNITLFENNSDTPWGYITPNHTGISLGTTDGRHVTLLSNTIEIYCNGNLVYLSGSGDDGTINLQSGNAKLNVNGGSMVTITQGGINITGSTGISPMIVKGVYNDYGTTQGFLIKCGSYVLEAKSDGLYYNGVKIGG